MREILFRGKRRDNGEWVVGQLIRYNDGRARIVETGENVFCYEMDISIIQTVAHHVIPETVGQYTGLCKNGKKIFEGDIAKEKDVIHNGEIQIKGDTYAVEMAEGCWFATCGEVMWFLGEKSKELEIIGNIHDNPELLEEGEEC